MNEADEEGSEVASWRWSMVGLGRIGLCLAARCGRLVHSAFRGIAGLGSAVAGLAVGWIGLRALGSLNLQDLPRGADIRFDGSTVGFTLAAAMMIGVVLGVIPISAKIILLSCLTVRCQRIGELRPDDAIEISAL